MEQIKVFGYARKSPDEKEDTKTSITNQVSMINSFCKGKSWVVSEIFIDKNISGGDRSRKEFLRMIDLAFKGECEIIVVKEQDRFARDSSFFMDTLKDLEVRGIRVFSILKNKFLSFEDLGDVVTSVVDAHFIITQRRKTKALFEQKKESGMPPIPAPFGYKINKKAMWIIDEKKAKIVIDVNDCMKRGVSYKDSGLSISKDIYYRIIKNIKEGVYSGFVIYENKIRDSNKIIVRVDKVKYKGLHEAIIKYE